MHTKSWLRIFLARGHYIGDSSSFNRPLLLRPPSPFSFRPSTPSGKLVSLCFLDPILKNLVFIVLSFLPLNVVRSLLS